MSAPGLAGYGAVGAAAALTTFGLTPLVRRLAIRVNAVVQPDERRVHEIPTPTLGGLAMFGGVLVGMAVAWRLHAFQPVFAGSSEPLGVVLAGFLILIVGVLDDLFDWSAPAKLSGMVLAASLLQVLGVTMFYFRVPLLGLVVLSPDLGFLISVLWVLGMANAINLIDGLDGLAAGIVAIASGAFFLYGQRLTSAGILESASLSPLLAIIVLGICIGFLPHNFNPAKIFMGDGGALLLGLLMASSTMVVGGQMPPTESYTATTYFFLAPLVIPLVILGVPILDTLVAIVRRASRRSGVAVADKDHLHHRLMRLGHGQRRSVLILWSWTAILSIVVLYPTYTNKDSGFLPLGAAALALALYTLFHPGRGRERVEVDAARGTKRTARTRPRVTAPAATTAPTSASSASAEPVRVAAAAPAPNTRTGTEGHPVHLRGRRSRLHRR